MYYNRGYTALLKMRKKKIKNKRTKLQKYDCVN